MANSNSTPSFHEMLLKFIGEADPMLSMLQWLCDEMMEAELKSKIGASKSERNSKRTAYRSGYRSRRFDTRMGTMYLMVPKLRKGGYIPFFINEKKRSEVALLNVIQEAYINGVSTRKIEKLAKSLGIDSISHGQVSNITREFNEQVEEFRNRRLDETYPAIWVDALYEKIRDGKRVRNMAVLVVSAVTMHGRREILAIEPMMEESTETYTILFDNLKSRGVEDVWLIISDAHKGLMKATQSSFNGSSWQRCKVHFMRNILAHIPSKEKKSFSSKLKQIWLQSDYESSKVYAFNFMEEYENKYPKAIQCLEEGLEDSLQFYHFPEIDSRKISSTNVLERLNREIRRRSNVIGIFPSLDSYIRLITTYMIEYSEDWSVGRSYINPKVIETTKENRIKVA